MDAIGPNGGRDVPKDGRRLPCPAYADLTDGRVLLSLLLPSNRTSEARAME